jgi:tetratricopeptide (TPR) repeat protein
MKDESGTNRSHPSSSSFLFILHPSSFILREGVMSLDPYATCPCGSGKKFKWCCQPIYPGIQHALELDAAGQHEAALRAIEQVTREHAGNPEAWGQYARLLYGNDKPDEAEEALEKAFALNPNYAFGLLLRATFRHGEGEFQGALLLARRAADAYDPQARDAVAQAYSIIFDCEMRRNRPVAARAALEQLARLQPGDDDLRASFENIFGASSRLPLAARKLYEFRKPQAARREAWNRILQGAGARLGDLVRAFEKITQEDANDAAAWFNLGVGRAWLGENHTALEALDRYLDLEADEGAAVEAAALGEVLRCGHGMDEESDYHEYAAHMQIRNPEPVNALLDDWGRSNRLLPVRVDQENVFHALVLELTPTGLVTVGRPAVDAGRLAAYLYIVGNLFRLAGPVKEPFDRLRDEARQKLGLGLTELQERRGSIQFHDVITEALIFPVGPNAEEKAAERILAHAGQFYEDTWIHRPRKSLNNIAPVDAVGSAKLRKKLLGVIAFIQQCASHGMLAGYDFDRLRRKLGLLAAPAAKPEAGGVPADISALGPSELAALTPANLTDEQLEQAYQTAHRLDAGELAAHFAGALVARPVQAARPDRYPFFSFLIQKALKDGAYDAALDQVNEGERVDCEHNEGRRRNEYELRRAQVHARRGEIDAAQDVYQRLIDRAPSNFKVRGQAAETMLGMKQPARALRFAEEGLTAARQANDRDSEQYLMELASAAKRQLG